MNDGRVITIAPVRKSILVRASQARAFEVFTAGLDRWWPKSHYVGPTQVTKDILEPRVGGRWYEIGEDGAETTVGHVLVWEPPRRLVFSWEINGDWKSDPSAGSEVEVRFIAESDESTRVELEHRLFERMGVEGTKMRNAVDNGWPGIIELFRQVAEQ
ncbi:SRPBCC family protein [Dongia sp.]|uniref:SRPBCC family protein n=1 Tax=Dongia sp. TaxID=1977262 RepID=UPI00375192BF